MEPIAQGPHALEMAYWWSQIILTVIAGVSAWFGYNQLTSLAESRRQELKISHANFVSDLDKRWESEEMQEVRRLFVTTRSKIIEDVRIKNPNVSQAEFDLLVDSECQQALSMMRKENMDEYMKLFTICGFCELVGLMVKREYISKEDAMGLFSGPIIQIARFFRVHIDDMAKQPHVPPGLYEHALFLFDLLRSTKDQ
jgi:hypothetical protein